MKLYVLMEAPSRDGRKASGPGKVISTPTSEKSVDEALESLWADDRVWWKAEWSEVGSDDGSSLPTKT